MKIKIVILNNHKGYYSTNVSLLKVVSHRGRAGEHSTRFMGSTFQCTKVLRNLKAHSRAASRNGLMVRVL